MPSRWPAASPTCGSSPVRPRPLRLRLPQKVRSRLDFIAEVDITLADRVHGVARAVLDAPRLARRAATHSRSGKMSVVTDWTDDKARRFGRGELALRHDLHTPAPCSMTRAWSACSTSTPANGLACSPWARTRWTGAPGGAARPRASPARSCWKPSTAGRIWLNLRRVDEAIPDYATLLAEIFDDLEGHAPGLSTFKRDMGLLISSANAQVFYHLDVPLVTLCGGCAARRPSTSTRPRRRSWSRRSWKPSC